MPSRTRALFAFPFAVMAFVAAHPSYGALATPKPVTPTPGAVSESLPVFGWNKVANADRYEFQVAADNGFNSPVTGAGEDHFVTRNTRATLKRTIPTGTYYWRVRAITKAGAVSPWTTPQQFKRSWTAAATLQAPSANAGLAFPANPLSLSWSTVPFATSYLVSIATDPALGSLVLHDTGSSAPVSTSATTLTSPSSFAPGTYYWAVTPVDARGNKGSASSVAAFSWQWPSATTPTVADVDPSAEVYDPQFSWTPVAGAARYEVEVNSTSSFTTGAKVCCTGTTTATSLSPTKVLNDNVYYWRVRAIDADGNAGVWNVGPSFTKAFDKTTPSVKNVRMVDANDQALAGPVPSTAVPVLRWDPVPGASSYQVDVTPYSAGCAWSALATVKWSVTTATTAWTPLGNLLMGSKPFANAYPVVTDMPAFSNGTQYCARVRARSDRDAGNVDVYGDYTYLNNIAGPGFTYDTSQLPASTPCGTPCQLSSSDYQLPQTGVTMARMPFFTWKPTTGKLSYWVIVAKDPSFTNVVDYAWTQVPAYAPRGQSSVTYPDEATSYYWAVLPDGNLHGGAASGDPRALGMPSFLKLSAPPTLSSPAEGSTVTGQPTFQWTAAEAARNYRIQVSQDPSFGSTLEDTTTAATSFTPNTTYPADTVLYWRVRANDENQLGMSWSGTGTFRRSLPAPVPSPLNPTASDQIPTWTWAPVTGAVAYDVAVDLPDGTHKDLSGLRMPAVTATTMTGTGLFKWRVRAVFPSGTAGTTPGPFSGDVSFTRTIGEPAGAHSQQTKDLVVLSWEPKQGAKEYRIQVSTTQDFGMVADDIRTDNTSYAPLLTSPAYLNGGDLYWRVAAIDANGNQGDYSPATKIGFAKKMRVSLTSFPMRGRKASVTVKVVDSANKPVAGAAVRVTGKGLKVGARRTTRAGTATFKLRGRKGLSIQFRAVKTGFDPATYVFTVR
jgi:hypothetical protein